MFNAQEYKDIETGIIYDSITAAAAAGVTMVEDSSNNLIDVIASIKAGELAYIMPF